MASTPGAQYDGQPDEVKKLRELATGLPSVCDEATHSTKAKRSRSERAFSDKKAEQEALFEDEGGTSFLAHVGAAVGGTLGI